MRSPSLIPRLFRSFRIDLDPGVPSLIEMGSDDFLKVGLICSSPLRRGHQFIVDEMERVVLFFPARSRFFKMGEKDLVSSRFNLQIPQDVSQVLSAPFEISFRPRSIAREKNSNFPDGVLNLLLPLSKGIGGSHQPPRSIKAFQNSSKSLALNRPSFRLQKPL